MASLWDSWPNSSWNHFTPFPSILHYFWYFQTFPFFPLPFVAFGILSQNCRPIVLAQKSVEKLAANYRPKYLYFLKCILSFVRFCQIYSVPLLYSKLRQNNELNISTNKLLRKYRAYFQLKSDTNLNNCSSYFKQKEKDIFKNNSKLLFYKKLAFPYKNIITIDFSLKK